MIAIKNCQTTLCYERITKNISEDESLTEGITSMYDSLFKQMRRNGGLALVHRELSYAELINLDVELTNVQQHSFLMETTQNEDCQKCSFCGKPIGNDDFDYDP